VVEKRGKFAALAELNRPRSEEEIKAWSEAAPEMVEQARLEVGKSRGRPATGKRSNPEWKLYSHFLKRKTQRAAVAKLQAEDSDRDLSDVLEELLENWVKL
jgi:hypothetical protein